MPFISEIDTLEDTEPSQSEFDYATDLAQFRYAELEHSGRELVGTLMRYGDLSTHNMSGSPERMEAGVFGDIGNSDVILNFQHDRRRPLARTGGGGLVLTDSAESLEIAATLPNTRDADDALELVREGVLRGFSSEFYTRRSRRDGNTNVIQAAHLPRVGLVDEPAYPDSLVAEIRQAGEGLAGEFLYDTDTIISASGKTRKESIAPGAFTYAVRAEDREINLILGNNERPLASKKAGSLVLKDTPKSLQFRVAALPRTSYVADFLGMLRSKTVTPGVVPFFEPTPARVARRLFSNGKAVEEQEESPGTGVFRRIVKSGLLTALSILFRPPRGNPGSVSRLPTRLRRPSQIGRLGNTADAVRPRSGDIVRNGRIIRGGQDIGPVMRQRWV